MSVRLSPSSTALLILVLAAPVFTVVRIADAYSDTVPPTEAEIVLVIEGYTLPEVVVIAEPYDPTEESHMAARPLARTTRPA